MRGEDQEGGNPPLSSPRGVTLLHLRGFTPCEHKCSELRLNGAGFAPRAPASPAAASVFDLGSSPSDAAWFCTRHMMRDSIHTNETKLCLFPSDGTRDGP